MEVLCLLGWLAGVPQGRTHTNTFLWHSLGNPNTPRSRLLCAHLWVGKPCQSILNFCGGFWKGGSTPSFPQTENLAVWAGGKPQPCLNTQLWTGLEIPNSCLQVWWCYKNFRGWHRPACKFFQSHRLWKTPECPFWQALTWKGPHFKHIKRQVFVFSVTLANLWAYLKQKQYDALSLTYSTERILPRWRYIEELSKKTPQADARQFGEQLWSYNKVDLVHGYLSWLSRSCHLLPENTLVLRLPSNQNTSTPPLWRGVRSKFSESCNTAIHGGLWSCTCPYPASVCST